MADITLWRIISAFKYRVMFTLLVVVAEAALMISLPAAIGYAVDQLMTQELDGLYILGGIGLLSLILGSLRRFYDTRIYSSMYAEYAPKLAAEDAKKGIKASQANARVNLLKEFFDFLEESLPGAVNILIGVVGVGIMIAQFNMQVFWGSCALLVLIILVFVFSGNWNYQFNAGLNSQLEKQVNIMEDARPRALFVHFNRMRQWQVKLSDLETANYFFIWLGIIALILFTPYAAVANGEATTGGLLSLMVYVFDYVDNVVMLPLLFQQLIRLQEIADRLTHKNQPATA